MIAASQHAIHNLGLRTDDPQYRDFIEQEAGLKPKVESRRSSTPTTAAAPPSRYVPGSGARGPNTITLTREQRDHARFLFPDAPDAEVQMAKRIQADFQAGLCDLQGRYRDR